MTAVLTRGVMCLSLKTDRDVIVFSELEVLLGFTLDSFPPASSLYTELSKSPDSSAFIFTDMKQARQRINLLPKNPFSRHIFVSSERESNAAATQFLSELKEVGNKLVSVHYNRNHKTVSPPSYPPTHLADTVGRTLDLVLWLFSGWWCDPGCLLKLCLQHGLLALTAQLRRVNGLQVLS